MEILTSRFAGIFRGLGGSPPIDRKLRVIVLAALVLMGGWSRFTATSFGLPDNFRPDEGLLVAGAMGLHRDLNPHMARYPAAQIYLLRGVLRAAALSVGYGGNLKAAFARDRRTPAYLIARRLSAAMGTATVIAVYMGAEPVFGATAALASAAIVTVSTIHVRESKFAKVEVPAGLWFALTVATMLQIVRGGRPLDYALAGFFSGLAGATHYAAGVVVFGILAAHLEACRRENRPPLSALADRRIYLAGATSILTFACATPYVFLDPQQTYYDYMRVKGWHGEPQARGWWWLLMRLMPDSIGAGLLIFLLASIAWVIFRPRPGTITLLASIAITILSLTIGNLALMYRYAVTPLLVMVFPAGIFVADLIALASARLGTRLGSALVAILFGLMLVPSLVRDIELNRLLLQTDTRTLAADWIAKNIPPRTLIAAVGGGSFGKPRLPALCKLVPIKALLLEDILREHISWFISDSFPSFRYSPAPSDAQLAALNSVATLLFDIDPLRAGAPAPVLDPNDAFYAPIQNITSMERPGPRIRIWKLKPSENPNRGKLQCPSSTSTSCRVSPNCR